MFSTTLAEKDAQDAIFTSNLVEGEILGLSLWVAAHTNFKKELKN